MNPGTHAELVAKFLDLHFARNSDLLAGQSRLVESMRYSILQDGSKRFRPTIAMLTAEALGWPRERVLPFAAAVECVHTYSLIHDDLPAMDDDDIRRGQPTNHKEFDEATAILAGDALLTEAFTLIAENYSALPLLAVRAIIELARASGQHGMVGGQAIDIRAQSESIGLEDLRTMHRLKTGALIRASVVGAAILCEASETQVRQAQAFADDVGLAFQVADDILDFDPAHPEPGSYPALMGVHGARSLLRDLTQSCVKHLETWPAAAEPLREIAKFNETRSI